MLSHIEALSMKRFLVPALIMATAWAQPPQQPPAGRGGRGTPAIQPKPEEFAAIRAKSEQIEAAVKDLRARHADGSEYGQSVQPRALDTWAQGLLRPA